MRRSGTSGLRRFIAAIIIQFIGCTVAHVLAADMNQQAFLLAAQSSQQLVPEADLVAQISADLTQIKTTFPVLANLAPRMPWMPGQILVGLEKGGKAKLAAGELKELAAANEKYGPVQVKPFGRLEVLTLSFEKPYNPEKLVELYTRLPGVKYAEPNRLAGDGDRLELKKATDDSRVYVFSKGWGDCPSGCIHRHFWEVAVKENVVTLVKEHGDPIP